MEIIETMQIQDARDANIVGQNGNNILAKWKGIKNKTNKKIDPIRWMNSI